jgi:hypothetical protein
MHVPCCIFFGSSGAPYFSFLSHFVVLLRVLFFARGAAADRRPCTSSSWMPFAPPSLRLLHVAPPSCSSLPLLLLFHRVCANFICRAPGSAHHDSSIPPLSVPSFPFRSLPFRRFSHLNALVFNLPLGGLRFVLSFCVWHLRACDAIIIGFGVTRCCSATLAPAAHAITMTRA